MTEPLATTTSAPQNIGTGQIATDASALSSLAPAEISQADVVISGTQCSIDAGHLNDVIRGNARSLMSQSLEQAYSGVFPVHIGPMLDFTISRMVTQENICHALMTPHARPSESQGALIKKYKNARLTKSGSHDRGIVAERFRLETDCSMNINYERSGNYSDVDDCEGVTEQLEDNPVPLILAVLPFKSGAVCNLFANPQFQTKYKNYPDMGPATCTSSNNAHTDTYNKISGGPLGSDVEFGLRGFNGRNWAATRMITSCTEHGSGEEHDDLDDMKFIFSARACVPLNVLIDGTPRRYTLYLDQVTGIPNSFSYNVASTVAAKTTIDASFEYLLGSMLAKILAAEERLK